MIVTFLIVLCAALLTALIVCAEALYRNAKAQAKPLVSRDEAPGWKFWEALKPAAPVEPPKDYAPASIPRGRTSWRKQMVALQVQHNSKQKERDAMFPQENNNAGKAR